MLSIVDEVVKFSYTSKCGKWKANEIDSINNWLFLNHLKKKEEKKNIFVPNLSKTIEYIFVMYQAFLLLLKDQFGLKKKVAWMKQQ